MRVIAGIGTVVIFLFLSKTWAAQDERQINFFSDDCESWAQTRIHIDQGVEDEEVVWNPKPFRHRGDLRLFLKRLERERRKDQGNSSGFTADDGSRHIEAHLASQVEALQTLASSLEARRENPVLVGWLKERALALEKWNLTTRNMVQDIFWTSDDKGRSLRDDNFWFVPQVREAWESAWGESQRILSQLRVLKDLVGLRGLSVPFAHALGQNSDLSRSIVQSLRKVKISAVHGDGAEWTIFIWADVAPWRRDGFKTISALVNARRSQGGDSLPRLSVAMIGQKELTVQELRLLSRGGVTVLADSQEKN